MPFTEPLAAVDEEEPHPYLASEDVTPDSVVFVDDGVLPVSGTPTLLMVDRDGVVTNAWIGLLSEERKAEVIDALFD